MKSKKQLAKTALKHPENYAPAELKYIELWLKEKKKKKELKKATTLQ